MTAPRKKKKKWSTELLLPGGHRIMRDNSSKLPAIADRSGTTPDTCDDGVLRLLVEEPILVSNSGGCAVAVFAEEKGELKAVKYSVGIGLQDAIILASKYEMLIEASSAPEGHDVPPDHYKVTRENTWIARHRDKLADDMTLAFVSWASHEHEKRNFTKKEIDALWSAWQAARSEYEPKEERK